MAEDQTTPGAREEGVDPAREKYDLMRDWVGETLDEEGNVVERRTIHNGRPFMSNAHGFGYV